METNIKKSLKYGTAFSFSFSFSFAPDRTLQLLELQGRTDSD
jgi:hypothetical protein